MTGGYWFQFAFLLISLLFFSRESPLPCSRIIGVSSGSGPAFSPVLIAFFLFHAEMPCFTLSTLELLRASLLLYEALPPRFRGMNPRNGLRSVLLQWLCDALHLGWLN